MSAAARDHFYKLTITGLHRHSSMETFNCFFVFFCVSLAAYLVIFFSLHDNARSGSGDRGVSTPLILFGLQSFEACLGSLSQCILNPSQRCKPEE